MKRFWILVSILWLATCGGGGGSPTEPKEPAPVSNFTATPTTLIQGQAVTFTSTSTGTITSYAWNVDNDPAIEATTATYEHTYTEVGTYNVTLTVTGPGGSNPKTVADMITVSTAAPTPTTATTQTVQEDGSTTISLTATDPNGQAVTFAITTDPTNGTATLSGTEITYTPNANFYGTDTVAYTASNGTYTSDPVTITITVEGQDDEPTTNDVSATIDEDTAVTLTLDATEIDGDNYSFSIVTQPTNGTLGSINGNQVEYTPSQDFNGTDTFTFEATDDRTFRRNVATATITVNPINDAPVANDVTASMDENKEFTRLMPVTITLDATDVEGDDLTYSIVGTPSNGTLGSITNNQVIYTPSQDYNGEDTFTYKANDGTADSNTATVTVTINAVNDAPVTTDQSASTDEDTAVEITLTATDVENDNLTFTIVSDVSNGTTALSGTTVTYTPTANFNGTDTFTFKANDGTDDSNTSTVTITVASVNDAPVANDVTASTQSRMNNMRQAVSITLDATDVEGDDLTYSLVSDVSNGTTSLSGNIVTYTPTANYDGEDTFTYKANDGTVDSNIATATITIIDTNQAPIANDMSLSLDREGFIDFTLDATDEDGDSLSKSIISQPENGTLIPGTGLNYTYTPDSGYFGTDSFTYKVNDGTSDSDVKTVSFTINQLVINLRNPNGTIDNNNTHLNIFRSQNSNFLVIQDDTVDGGNNSSFVIEFNDNLEEINSTKFGDNRYFISDDLNNDGNEHTVDMKKFDNGFISHSFNNIKIFDLNFNLNSEFSMNFNVRAIEAIGNDFFLIGGYETNGGTYKPILKKVDSSGNISWSQEYNLISDSQEIFNIKKLSDGNYFFVAGYTGRYVKVDSNGEIIWSATPSNSGVTYPTDIIEDNQLIYIFNDGNELIKLDLNGNELLSTNIAQYSGYYDTHKMIIHSDGDLVFGGINNGSISVETDNKIRMERRDTNGNLIWSKEYTLGFVTERSVIRIIESSDGNLIFMLRNGNADNFDADISGLFKVDFSDGTILLP